MNSLLLVPSFFLSLTRRLGFVVHAIKGNKQMLKCVFTFRIRLWATETIEQYVLHCQSSADHENIMLDVWKKRKQTCNRMNRIENVSLLWIRIDWCVNGRIHQRALRIVAHRLFSVPTMCEPDVWQSASVRAFAAHQPVDDRPQCACYTMRRQT